MDQPKLFCGILLNKQLLEEFKKAPAYITSQFIKTSDPDYLSFIEYSNTPYLGKILGDDCNPDDFDHLEQNIYSLLKKIIPNVSPQENPPVLFPVSSL